MRIACRASTANQARFTNSAVHLTRITCGSIHYYTARLKITRRPSMLVLSRKESQRIRLGDSIVITIVKISGDKVRVGIEAPANVLVLRDELEVRTPSTPSPPVEPGAAAEPLMLRHSA